MENKIKPFVINSNICTSYEDISSYERFMDAIAGNTGNSYITWALLKEIGCTIDDIKDYQIKNVYSYDWESNEEKDLDKINNECTNVILVLQDQIRIHESYGYRLPFRQLTNFIKKIKKPILVAGLGANSLDGFVPDFHLKLDDELISFLRFLSENVEMIGIRGYFTQEVLHNLGVKNTQVIGCPSYYETGENRIIVKPEWRDDLNIGVSTGIAYWKYGNSIYLQDAQSHEAVIIKWIGYGQKSIVAPRVLQKIGQQQYKVFSSIQKWKEDVAHCDFYVGGRVHGSMVAMNSGVPTVVMSGDSRAREMCEFMNIPFHPELKNCKCLRDIYEACDYTKMNAEYNDKLENYISFLQKNGVDYVMTNSCVEEVSLNLYMTKKNWLDDTKSILIGLPIAVCNKIQNLI